jgi:DNA-binding protein H-NS
MYVGPLRRLTMQLPPLQRGCTLKSRMDSGHRYQRARAAALFEAQGLVQQHRITSAELIRLQEEIEESRQERRHLAAQAIEQARALMDQYKISVDDLLDSVGGEQPTAPLQTHSRQPRITHRHPDPTRSETWDGQGAQPDWVRHALLVEGLRPADLRVAADSA